MPLIVVYDKPCRARPLLNAIGAQEALEHHNKAWAGKPLLSYDREDAAELERLALARRRNVAEKKLRPAEHEAWAKWRASNLDDRATVYAMLTDLPPTEPKRKLRGRKHEQES